MTVFLGQHRKSKKYSLKVENVLHSHSNDIKFMESFFIGIGFPAFLSLITTF
jgi:hypothetical protein